MAMRLEPTAAWGDAEARRRDILLAATALLDAGGYGALTMRAIAERAGMSAGTIYQYYAGKESVFSALMVGRMEEMRQAIEQTTRSHGLTHMLRAIVPRAVELWRSIGGTAAVWERDLTGTGRPPVGLSASPAARPWESMLDALRTALQEAAAHEGLVLREGPPLVPYVWGGLMGLADDLVHGWSQTAGLETEELIAFTVEAVTRGIVEDPGDRPSRTSGDDT
jgi:AcrR family transcriptional regulator